MFFGISSTNKLISFAIKESLYNSLIVPNVISFFVLLILVTYNGCLALIPSPFL